MIWKGINSNTIRGLVIQNTPPITKPQMRYNEVVVNGRDGSIIEELGYSPYDKTIKIGLKSDADVNSIISYFSGSGQLAFENEAFTYATSPIQPYYNATIISQIDYAKLLRFRTAQVKFRVQPYKYDLNETAQTTSTINNIGNVPSKPLIVVQKLTGGTIEYKKLVGSVYETLFTYTFPSGETYVYIDSEKEEAYFPDDATNPLRNRYMTGNFPTFDVGMTTIDLSNNLRQNVTKVSRWI